MKRLVVLVLLLSGCSLPLPGGVRSVEGVSTEQQQQPGGGLRVIPPGPREGQTPEDVVRGFLQAQASFDDAHAIARSYLTAAQATAWDDTAGARVYELRSLETSQTERSDDTTTVTVTAQVTGSIGGDAGYQPMAAQESENYLVRREGGQWRLALVPPGLRLTATDRDRSFQPTAVYYPGQVPQSGAPRLVPDRVFLPAGPDFAERLVRRVLAPPTASLAGSVGHEPGLSALSVRTDSAGVVTVDLGASARDLAPEARKTLSAQLVWTLRELGTSFSGLRLLVAGSPFTVPGEGAVQDDGAWDEYDPEGVGANPPYLFVASSRLRANGLTLPSNEATAGDAGQPGTVAVDDVALTPDRTQVALLEGTAPGLVTVRTGPLRGPYRRVVTTRDLRSPSWGSGDRGLWLVRDRTSVALLQPGRSVLDRVPVLGRPPGRLNALAASRDGARIALVYGTTLYVGRVEVTSRGPRIAGLRALDPGGTAVTDVAWSSGTFLAVVGSGRSATGALTQVARIAVDGSGVDVRGVGTLVPEALTASAAGIVLEADDFLYSLTGRTPARVGAGTRPAYPG